MLGERAGAWLGARLGHTPFCRVDFEAQLLVLSEIHASLRAADASSGVGAFLPRSGGGKSTEFRRSVTKYWVRNEDEVEVLTKVLQHLPVFNPAAEANAKAAEMGQWVTSVYLDSPEFESYR